LTFKCLEFREAERRQYIFGEIRLGCGLGPLGATALRGFPLRTVAISLERRPIEDIWQFL
jgi:hypothetical protein